MSDGYPFPALHRLRYDRIIAKLHVTWKETGIKPGDKIALAGRNCANWGLLFLAITSYKAVVVSILPDFTAEGIHSLVDHSEAVLLYVGPNVKKVRCKPYGRVLGER